MAIPYGYSFLGKHLCIHKSLPSIPPNHYPKSCHNLEILVPMNAMTLGSKMLSEKPKEWWCLGAKAKVIKKVDSWGPRRLFQDLSQSAAGAGLS